MLHITAINAPTDNLAEPGFWRDPELGLSRSVFSTDDVQCYELLSTVYARKH